MFDRGIILSGNHCSHFHGLTYHIKPSFLTALFLHCISQRLSVLCITCSHYTNSIWAMHAYYCRIHELNTVPAKSVTVNSDKIFLMCLFQTLHTIPDMWKYLSSNFHCRQYETIQKTQTKWEKLYESGARMETSPRQTVTQLVQQLGISTIWHEI
jgi:hypothetical protein